MQRPYKQLSLEDRRKIEEWRAAKVSVDVIADRPGRDRPTIFRELRRNHFKDTEMPRVVGYSGLAAYGESTLTTSKGPQTDAPSGPA